MTAPADVLTVAAGQIGQHEQPPGSNRTPYGAWYGLDGNAWCAMFVSWCFSQAGMPLPASKPQGFALCSTGVAWFKSLGAFHSGTGGIASGDVVFYSYQGGAADHVEIVESTDATGFTTIGGNVSDRVGRFHRTGNDVVGYGRPTYGAAGSSTGVQGTATPIGFSVPNPLDTVTSALGQLAGLAQFAAKLADPALWFRALEIAVGLGLALGGVALIYRDTINAKVADIGKLTAKAAVAT